MPKFGLDPDVIVRTSDEIFYQALHWTEPTLIFTCSWSDFFIEEADEWRKDAWDVIRKTPQHTWQILTKRPERIMNCLPDDWGDGWDHVWLGVSIENQDYLHRSIALSKVPAAVRFISAEPLLAPIDFISGEFGHVIRESFTWCIVGGESGFTTGKYGFRECKLSWIEQIMMDLEDTPVRVFVKQLGTYLAMAMRLKDWKGEDIMEWPRQFRVREFPPQAKRLHYQAVEASKQ